MANAFEWIGDEIISPLASGLGLKGPDLEDTRENANQLALDAETQARRNRDDSAFVSDIQGRRQERQGMADQAGRSFAQADQMGLQTRGQQLGVADRFLAAADPRRGPSAAELQLQAGLDQGLAQQLALAQAGRGNSALALRNAATNAGQLAAQTNQQAGVLRAQEQAQEAQRQLAALQGAQQAFSGARAADMARAGMFDARQVNALGARDQLDLQNAGLALNARGLSTGLAGQVAQQQQAQAGANAQLYAGLLSTLLRNDNG